MYSGVFHLDDETRSATFSDPALRLYPASSGEGLAGSILEGGVLEDVVNLESRVSREYSLPTYRNAFMSYCLTLHVARSSINWFGSAFWKDSSGRCKGHPQLQAPQGDEHNLTLVPFSQASSDAKMLHWIKFAPFKRRAGFE